MSDSTGNSLMEMSGRITLNSILTEDATEINKFKNINPSLLYHIV